MRTAQTLIRPLAVAGEYSVPNMRVAQTLLEQVTSLAIPDSGHLVPEEQLEALAKALMAFL